jgi:hypothetical protein
VRLTVNARFFVKSGTWTLVYIFFLSFFEWFLFSSLMQQVRWSKPPCRVRTNHAALRIKFACMQPGKFIETYTDTQIDRQNSCVLSVYIKCVYVPVCMRGCVYALHACVFVCVSMSVCEIVG